MTWDDRVKAIADHGFTERQASFLVTVMLHSGVCLGRNYSAYARIAHGGANGEGSVHLDVVQFVHAADVDEHGWARQAESHGRNQTLAAREHARIGSVLLKE